MEKIDEKKYKFGLVGKNISYSFSRGYFSEKFKNMGLNSYSYENFDLKNIDDIKDLLENNKNLKGLNVTIPYKQEVIAFLDKLDDKALKIGAVNTIKFSEGKRIGHNTDAYGFQKSLEPYLKKDHKKALVLGTGGASKAIVYVLNELGIKPILVSRNPSESQLNYSDLNKETMDSHTLIVNCTPLGTFPNVQEKPNIPYEFINANHVLFDLIYNPEKTAFLASGEARGAIIGNGQKMLELQAEESWQIWNS